jgi:hypothetical protein
VRQPVLLIVGELDTEVIELNRWAMRRLGGESRLVIVEGASHLFEEPGALEQVARLARAWFADHLKPGQRAGHSEEYGPASSLHEGPHRTDADSPGEHRQTEP